MSDIFREVDEEVRHDQLIALWQKFGPYIIGGAIAIVLGVGARAFWTNHVTTTKLAESAVFDSAIEQLNNAETDAGLAELNDLIASSSSGYGVMAQFRKAAVLIDQENRPEALAVYDEIMTDASVSERLQEYARLLGAMTALDIEDATAVNERLQPLLNRDSHWYYSASEISGLSALRSGDLETAQSVFSGLMVDPDSPMGIKQRANEILDVVESQLPDDPIDLGLSLQESSEEVASDQTEESAEDDSADNEGNP